MERYQTGEARLKGILPEGTIVAHKTGTVGNTTNDIGIITLPIEGRTHRKSELYGEYASN